MTAKSAVPYQFNAFGNLLDGDGLSVTGGALTLQTPAPTKRIAVIVATAFVKTIFDLPEIRQSLGNPE